jgi:hypothetical protein
MCGERPLDDQHSPFWRRKTRRRVTSSNVVVARTPGSDDITKRKGRKQCKAHPRLNAEPRSLQSKDKLMEAQKKRLIGARARARQLSLSPNTASF